MIQESGEWHLRPHVRPQRCRSTWSTHDGFALSRGRDSAAESLTNEVHGVSVHREIVREALLNFPLTGEGTRARR